MFSSVHFRVFYGTESQQQSPNTSMQKPSLYLHLYRTVVDTYGYRSHIRSKKLKRKKEKERAKDFQFHMSCNSHITRVFVFPDTTVL